MNIFLIPGILVALIGLGYLFFKRCKNASLYGPLVIYPTKRGIKFIDKAAKLSPRFWKVFSTFGAALAIFFIANLVYTLILNAHYILTTPDIVVPGIVLAIPGITIPLWGGLLGILVLVIVHEFSHGIIARAENIKVESVGSISLGFIPLGAFVKPDEKSIKKSKALTQLRIYAAGSFMNILTAILVLALLVFLILPSFTAPMQGVKILHVEEGNPADLAGLQEDTIILQIGETSTPDLFKFVTTLERLDLKPGDFVELKSSDTTYTIEMGDKNGDSYMGINFCGQVQKGELFQIALAYPFILRYVNPSCYPVAGVHPGIFWFIFGLLIWVIILNYGVGLFNLLPVKPLDGGLMTESIANRLIKNKKLVNYIVYGITFFALALLLINLIVPYL